MDDLAPAYRYKAVLVRATDGDTYELDIDLGFYVHTTVAVRLRGWNCPEMPTPEGKHAQAVALRLLRGRPLIVESYHDRRSFARWVADVWVLKPKTTKQPERWVAVGDCLCASKVAVPMKSLLR